MTTRLSLIVAGFLAYGLQIYFYLEGDVIYLIHAAQHLLHGGNYINNFFETNPPLILYLYFPVILSMQFFKIKLILAVRLYIISLALLSILACNYFIKRCQLNTRIRLNLLITITLILLFLPLCEFAQREHLLLIFTLPYWFLVLARIEKAPIPFFPALLCGISAGLGFALKPFFLPPLLLTEFYFCLREKSTACLFRVETLCIAGLLSLYALSLFIFQPDYVQVILPLVSKYYFIGSAETWSTLLDRPPALFCLIVALFIPAFCKILRSSTLGFIFSCTLLGFILSFLLPKTAWYYHVLPALSLCILLGALLIAEAPNKLIAGGLIVVFLSIPVVYGLHLFNSEVAIRNNPALNEVIQLARAKRIYCLPTHGACSVISAYTQAQYVSRFPSLWVLRGILKHEPSLEVAQDEDNFLNLLFTDLKTTQPDLVIFDNTVGLPRFKSSQDYLTYFSRYPKFNRFIKDYRYLKSIGPYEIYIHYT